MEKPLLDLEARMTRTWSMYPSTGPTAMPICKSVSIGVGKGGCVCVCGGREGGRKEEGMCLYLRTVNDGRGRKDQGKMVEEREREGDEA